MFFWAWKLCLRSAHCYQCLHSNRNRLLVSSSGLPGCDLFCLLVGNHSANNLLCNLSGLLVRTTFYVICLVCWLKTIAETTFYLISLVCWLEMIVQTTFCLISVVCWLGHSRNSLSQQVMRTGHGPLTCAVCWSWRLVCPHLPQPSVLNELVNDWLSGEDLFLCPLPLPLPHSFFVLVYSNVQVVSQWFGHVYKYTCSSTDRTSPFHRLKDHHGSQEHNQFSS